MKRKTDLSLMCQRYLKRILVGILFLVASLHTFSQTSFYTVGNSFTDHINAGYSDVALSMGEPIDFGRHTIPGAPLNFIWDNPGSGVTEQGSFDVALPNKSWDFVSLQPWDESVSAFSTAADNFAKLTYQGNQDAKMLVLATASFSKLGHENIGDYYNAFISEGTGNLGSKAYFEALVDNLKSNNPGKIVALIPVQHVLAEVDRRLMNGEVVPEVSSLQDFHLSDTNSHFDAKARYLAQLAAYSTMFAQKPSNATLSFASFSVSQAFAEYAWDLVWDVVSNESYAQLTEDPTVPVADFSASTLKGDAPLSVDFDASSSYDTDGSIVSYAWDFGDGQTASGASVNHSYAAGVYPVSLTVTDNDGKINTVSDFIEVNDPTTSDNLFLESQCAQIGGNWVLLEGPNYSLGQAYVIASGLNSTGSAPTGSDDRISFTFEAPTAGSYNVFARVNAPSKSDDSFYVRANGGSWVTWNNIGNETAEMLWSQVGSSFDLAEGENTIDFAYREDGTVLDKIFVTQSTTAPTGMGLPPVNCQTDTQAPSAPTNLTSSEILVNGVTLSWTESTDNVAVDSYEIYKDGSLSAVTSNTNYNITGLSPSSSYNFTVKAKDASGNVSGDSNSESVTTLDNNPPVAVVATDVTSGNAPLTVNFSGSNSYDNDPGDVVIGYDWDFGDGNTYGSVNQISHTYETPGTYTATMGAVDLFGVRSQTTVNINVTDPNGGGSTTATTCIEAESGTVVAPMTIVDDANASGGQYITVAPGNTSTGSVPADGYVEYSFEIAEAGDYILWGRTIAPNKEADSFWIQVNGGSAVRWNNIAPSTDWAWDDVHNDPDAVAEVFTLSAGTHTLRVTYREDGTKLDKLYFTKDGDTPSGLGCDPQDTTPTYSLSVSGANGTVDPSAGTYDEGTVVTLTATPDEGYQFDGWNGDISGSSNPVDVTMDADKSVTANFSLIPATYSTCIEAESGTVVAPMTIVDDANASGGQYITVAPGNTSTGSVPADGYVEYSFEIAEAGDYILWGRTIAPNKEADSFWIQVNGGSAVRWNNIAPSTDWAWDDVHNDPDAVAEVFTLSAGTHTLRVTYREDGTKLDKLYFTKDGDTPSGLECDPQDTTPTYSLSVSGANGTVDPSAGTYDEGTVVTLTATPDEGYQFDGWNGDISGSSNPVDVTMDADKSVTANFSLIPVSSGTSICLEAEEGSLTAPLEIKSDADASNGQYIVSSSSSTGSVPSDGHATYTFEIAEDGQYIVWAREYVPSGSNDSYYVKMDDGEWITWNNMKSDISWVWDDVHDAYTNNQTVVFDLTAGTHTLTFAYREPGAQLDKLYITKDGDVPESIYCPNDPNFYTFSAEGLTTSFEASSSTISITSSVNWTLSENTDWLSIDKTSISGNDNFTVSVTENTANTARKGVITISSSVATKSFEVVQFASRQDGTYPSIAFGMPGEAPAPTYNDLIKQALWMNVTAWDSGHWPAAGTDVHGRIGFGYAQEFPQNQEYVLTWEGSGNVYISDNLSTLVSEDLSSNPKRRVYNLQPSSSGIKVRIDQFPVTNIKLWLPGQEDNPKTWYEGFINYLEPFAGKAIRFMDPVGTNGSTNSTWAGRATLETSSYTGASNTSVMWGYEQQKGSLPFEAIVELGNELEADVWVCIPHLATDEYIQNMATLIETGIDPATGKQVCEPLGPNQKLWVEYSNEVWNWIFDQTNWVLDTYGPVYNSNNIHKIAAIRTGEVLDIFNTAWQDDSRLIRVMPTQTGWGGGGATLDRLKNVDRSQYDVLAITTYFDYNICNEFIYPNWPVTIEETLDEMISRIGDTGPFLETDEIENNYWDYKHAADYNVPVVAYEGNEHIAPGFKKVDTNGDGSKDTPIADALPESVDFIQNMMRHPKFAEAYGMVLDKHYASGLQMHNAFVLMDDWSKWGQWGHIEYYGQPLTEANKYKFLLDYYNLPYPDFTIGSYEGIKSVQVLRDSFEEPLPAFSIYPNPATDHFTIQTGTENSSVQILNMNGQVMFNEKVSTNTIRVNCNHFETGVYLVVVINENGKMDKRKLIVY